MSEKDREGLLYKVASLYYEQGMKKFEIAGEIKHSPTQVANLLKEAQEAGIVKIVVNLPRLQDWRDKLKKKFGLQDAVVVPGEKDCAVLLKLLGKAAAEYFEESVTPKMNIALGGGYLVYEMISALPDRRRGVDIYPAAIIGRGPTIAHIDPMILVTLLWAKSGREQGRAHYVTVLPPEKGAGREEVQEEYKRFYKNRKKVRELFEEMKNVDAVFASIGGLEVNNEYRSVTRYATQNLLGEMNLTEEELREEGAVGDITYSFFNEKGDTKPEWNFFLSLGVKHLKQMAADPNKKVVVIVGGYKIEALKAVLRGKICNVLITDAQAAESILDEKL